MLPTLEDFKSYFPYFLPNELQLAFEPLIKRWKEHIGCKLDLDNEPKTLARLYSWTRSYRFNSTHSGDNFFFHLLFFTFEAFSLRDHL